MKKFLLTLATAAIAMTAAAQTELNVNDATTFDGTWVEEALKADGTVQAAAHYQPINSFKLGDYTVSFTDGGGKNAAAYYYATSTSTNQQKTVRIYASNTMTITAPEGVTMSKLEFTGSNLGTGAAFTVDNGTWTTDNNAVWTGSANSVTVTANASWRWSVVKVTTGEGGGSTGGGATTIFSEPFETGLGQFTMENVAMPEPLTYVWSFAAGYGAKASGYASGAAFDTEAWLISPEIDLAGATNVTLSFDHACNFFASVDAAKTETGVYVRTVGGEWTALTATYPEALSWTFVPAGEISLASVEGKKMQIGFKYTSTSAKAGTWEIKNVVVKGEGGSVVAPPEPELSAFVPVTSDAQLVEGGKYIVTIDQKYGLAVAPTVSYGRFSLINAKVEGDKFMVEEKQAFVLSKDANGFDWNMKDAEGRFYAMAADKLSTFQMYTEYAEGCAWMFAIGADGKATITNNLTNCIVAQGFNGTSGTWYGNVAPTATETADGTAVQYNLPVLYVLEGTAGVENISTENAPVEYFNLQGIRVANPENGIFIRRQGRTATKVAIR